MTTRAPKGPTTRQHLLNLGISALLGLVVAIAADSLTWGLVTFLVTSILVHTVVLNLRLK